MGRGRGRGGLAGRGVRTDSVLVGGAEEVRLRGVDTEADVFEFFKRSAHLIVGAEELKKLDCEGCALRSRNGLS